LRGRSSTHPSDYDEPTATPAEQLAHAQGGAGRLEALDILAA
jgi:hypothetical protein